MKKEFVEIINRISNSELNEILNYCKDESIFFDKETRLLSISEIINYKEELKIKMDIIPIIDIYDNNYIVFDITNNQFAMMDISEEVIFKKLESIEEYIEKVKQYYENI